MQDQINRELKEFNNKYSGLQKISPEAVRLRQKIEEHKRIYEKYKEELRGWKYGG